MIDFEDLEDIVGSFCTLLYPRRGQTEGTIVEDMGNELLIQLINGKEVVEYRDDVVIYEQAKKGLWACQGLQTLFSLSRQKTLLQFTFANTMTVIPRML